MVKSTKSNSKSINQPMIMAVWCAILAVLLLGMYGYSKINQRLNLEATSRTVDYIKTSYVIERLEFCVANKITDCNNETLYDWNDAHPKNQFKVRSDQALINENTDDKGMLPIR